MDFDRCSEVNKNKLISVEENAKKFTIVNNKQRVVRKVKVDGCLITGEQERCDYLFEIDKSCTCVIYLELKGKNIEKAYSQLIATIHLLLERHKNCEKHCYIISSRVPKLDTTLQQLKVKMAKQGKAKLLVKNNYCQLEI